MSLVPNEQALNGNGDQGANPETSNPQGQPLEVKLTKVESDLARLSGMVSALQGNKDKAAFRAEQTANSALGQIANIAKYLGVSPEQVQEAQRRSVLDDLVSQKIDNESITASPAGTGSQGGSALEKLTDIDSALGLPSNDPRVTNLKLLYADKPSEYLKQAVGLRDSINQNQSPTPAEHPLPPGKGAATGGPTLNALQNEYETKRGDIMNAGYTANVRVEKLTELKAVMRNKGLPIR